MTEFYFGLRAVHMTCAALTIALFFTRGVMMMLDSPRLAHPVVRWTPVAVDTLLLTSALMLTTIIHQYPFTTSWLTVKVVLLVVYIGLGSIALRRGRTKTIRVAAFVAALATVAFLVSVARTHSPLGIFAG
ncbi:MAG: hypothetical protein FIB04_07115 [Gammaproteobacteria bacterium]|nr:hypothetical protein [Gammaproteobacteria bacterium]